MSTSILYHGFGIVGYRYKAPRIKRVTWSSQSDGPLFMLLNPHVDQLTTLRKETGLSKSLRGSVLTGFHSIST